jgi:hypothetical protein
MDYVDGSIYYIISKVVEAAELITFQEFNARLGTLPLNPLTGKVETRFVCGDYLYHILIKKWHKLRFGFPHHISGF